MKNILKNVALLTTLALIAFSCREKPISPSELPSEASAFIETYFPNAEISFATKEAGEYEVVLKDNTRIDFDRRIEWEEIDCSLSTVFIEVPNAVVPEAILNYMQTNHPDKHIVKISRDRNWEIELENGLELEFNSNFTLVETDL